MKKIKDNIINEIENTSFSIVTGLLYKDEVIFSNFYEHFSSFKNLPSNIFKELDKYYSAIETYENYVKKETNEFIKYNEEQWDHVPWHDYDKEPSNNLEAMKMKFMELAYSEGVSRFMIDIDRMIELEGFPKFTKKYNKIFNNIGKELMINNIYFTDTSKYQSVDFNFDTFFNFEYYDEYLNTNITF